ncbi:Emopamil-binding protein [Amylostereum chailletii]|nr:Emopamil-binding protein [Amylostereum chailletii]
MLETTSPTIFTATSAYSLAGVAGLGTVAYVANRVPSQERTHAGQVYTFDALIHFIFEGSFLWNSMFGRSVNTGTNMFAEMWREYAAADFRWGTSDPTVVSLEILTVLGAGPMAAYIVYQIVRNDPARHYWLVVLSTAELYGGWMTFCPEWLTGSPNLDTSNALFLWVYLVLMNTIWVFIPFWLMFDSYGHIAGTLRKVQTQIDPKKTT